MKNQILPNAKRWPSDKQTHTHQPRTLASSLSQYGSLEELDPVSHTTPIFSSESSEFASSQTSSAAEKEIAIPVVQCDTFLGYQDAPF